MNTNINNEGQKKDERKSRKGLIGLAAAATAGALVLTGGWAFFSDYEEATGSGTAGTLDITLSDVTYTQNGSTVSDLSNLNPGDVATIKANVTSDGSKSAWVRELVDVTTDDGMGEYIYVWADAVDVPENPSAMTGGELVGSDDLLTGLAGDAAVLNGTVEKEAASNPVGVESVPVELTVYFDAAALNSAQGDSLSVSLQAQALQFRNNSSPNWAGTIEDADAVTTP